MKRNEVERQEPQAPSTNDLPLDEAALDRLHDNHAHDLVGDWPSVIAQARTALTFRARVAELEQRERDSDKAHACQVARVEILLREKAELEGELAEADRLLDMLTSICKRTALALKGPEPDMGLHDWSDLPEHALLQVEVEARLIADLNRVCAHANALRDALEKASRWFDPRDTYGNAVNSEEMSADIAAALASTPAADLAAYRKSVLEEAAKECEHGIPCGPTSNETEYGYNRGRAACAKDIRALAAQEVTK